MPISLQLNCGYARGAIRQLSTMSSNKRTRNRMKHNTQMLPLMSYSSSSNKRTRNRMKHNTQLQQQQQQAQRYPQQNEAQHTDATTYELQQQQQQAYPQQNEAQHTDATTYELQQQQQQAQRYSKEKEPQQRSECETRQYLQLGLPEEEHTPQTQLKTKHGRIIARLLGETLAVMEYDTLRLSLKTSSKKPTTKQKHEHKVLLAQLQRDVQTEKTNLLTRIKHNESDYLNTHHSLPDSKCTEYTQLTNILSLFTKILATWNINF